MKAHFFARLAAFILAALIIPTMSAVLFAADYYFSPSETALGNGDDDGGVGGRLGENYNSPSANGGNGNSAAENNGRDGQNGGMYADTTEDGEVLGVMDTENSATVGIVIAILIAVAVIVLIIALIPKGTSGV